jgi:hypothetical protein
MRAPRLLLAFLLGLPLLAVAVGPAAAKDPEPTVKGLAVLDWLQGAWRTAEGSSTWETTYTSPEGGEILSATKEISGGKVVTYDFERFFEKDGKVVLTPFPHGRKSLDFPLEKYDAAAKRAVFTNAANDFPSTFTYERPSEGQLKITLEGKHGSEPMKIVLAFKKR